MFIARDKRKRCRGFTLLEIIMATAILGLMAMAIFRFVQSNLIALRVSATQNLEEARYSGLLELLTTQWQSLPAGVGARAGDTYKFQDPARDVMGSACGAGRRLLICIAGRSVTALMM